MARKGIYRIDRDNPELSTGVVEDDTSGEPGGRQETTYTKSDYESGGYEPSFEKLPTKAQYEADLAEIRKKKIEAAKAAAEKKDAQGS